MQSAWLDTAVQLRQLPVAADIQRSLASSRACGRAIQALEHQDFYFAYCQLQFGHACNSDLAIQVVAAEIKLSEAGLALLDDLMAKNYMTVSTGQCASSDHLRTGLGLSELGVPLALGSHWIHTRFALDSLWIRPRFAFALDSPSIRPGFALRSSLSIRSRFTLDSLAIRSPCAMRTVQTAAAAAAQPWPHGGHHPPLSQSADLSSLGEWHLLQADIPPPLASERATAGGRPSRRVAAVRIRAPLLALPPIQLALN